MILNNITPVLTFTTAHIREMRGTRTYCSSACTVICYTRSQPWGYGHHPRGSRMQQRIHINITRPLISTQFSEHGEFSSSSPRKFVIQTWFCNCPQYLCLFHILFECSPKYMINERCGFSQILSTFHIGSMLCFFPANFMSSTYTDKNNPFSR